MQAVVQAQVYLLEQLVQKKKDEWQQEQQEDHDDEKRDPIHLMTVKGSSSSSNNNNNNQNKMKQSIPFANNTRVHVRLMHLPPYCFKSSSSSSHHLLQASDVGQIVQVTGTVVRTGPVQMYESARSYQCCHGPGAAKGGGSRGKAAKGSACGTIFAISADLEQRHNAFAAATPEQCPNKQSGSGSVLCHGTAIKLVPNGSVHTDYQEIKIQESASHLSVGQIPRSLLIKLQHDLVDTCQPGDEVVVVGSLLAQWHSSSSSSSSSSSDHLVGTPCHVTMALSAHSIRVVAEKGSSAWKNAASVASSSSSSSSSTNKTLSGSSGSGDLDQFRVEFEQYWQQQQRQSPPQLMVARDFICQAVCPKLYGLQVIKLALLLTLIGGVSTDAYLPSSEQQQQQQQQADHEKENEHHDENHDDNGAPDPFVLAECDSKYRRAHAAAYHDELPSSSSSSSQPTNKRRRDEAKKNNNQVQTRRRDQSHMLLVGDPGR